MKLKSFLELKQISTQELAKAVGIHKVYASGIITGRMKPSLKVAKIIQYVTKGVVTIEDIFDAHEDRKKYIEEKKKNDYGGENLLKF